MGSRKDAARGGHLPDDSTETERAHPLQQNSLLNRMSKPHQHALMIAAGLRPGPHISLLFAIDKFKKEKIREIILYMCFLVVFITSSNIQRDVEDAHYYAGTVKNVILHREFPTRPYAIRFGNISSHSNFWDFLEEVVPPMLFQEKWYNGESFDGAAAGQVLLANRLVQAPRLRQVRTSPKICNAPARLEAYISECYPKSGKSSRDPIPGWPNGTRMEYRTSRQLNSKWIIDNLYPYEAGGFMIDFPLNTTQKEMRQIVKHLRKEKWTDGGTRAVFFDFALYNANLRFYLSVRLQWEFSSAGKVSSEHFFRPMRLELFTTKEYVALVLDMMVYCFILLYSVEDSARMLRMRRAYWDDPWRFFHWMMYSFFLITFVFKVQFLLTSLSYVNSAADQDSEQAILDFEYLGWIHSQIWNWTGFNTVCVWFRAFSFLKFVNDGTSQLAATISGSTIQMGRFLCVFIIVIFVYSVSFTLAFGTDIWENRTLFSSAVELMKVFALGSKHFDNISQVNSLLGPLLFLTFQVGCGFILFGLPAAILNKVYRSISNSGVDDPVAKEFRKVIHKAIGRFLKSVYYLGKKDASQRFREERDQEFEDIFCFQETETAAETKASNQQILDLLNIELQGVATYVSSVKDKIDAFERQQGKQYAKEPKSTVKKPTLVIGRRVAWCADAMGEISQELDGCIPVHGNKVVVPPDWTRHVASDGNIFFHNPDTGKSQWDPPTIFRAARQSDPGSSGTAQAGGWEVGADDGAGVFAGSL